MKKRQLPVDYSSYLQLDKILESQLLKSVEQGTPSHDEMLFIIIHQTYELWFKQVLHELDSVISMFKEDYVDERNIGVAIARLHRIVEILKVLIDQIRILETMTPQDFLDFRNLLTPASGFQSMQFRLLEIKLGLETPQRVKYSQQAYHQLFPPDQQGKLLAAESQPSLFDLLQSWLERTPFLAFTGYNFVAAYQKAVGAMLKEEEQTLISTALDKQDRQHRLQMLRATQKHFETILQREKHDQLLSEGRRRLSYDATLAALFINLYRDQPILHLPFKLLAEILDIDELLSTWRYRHALMVLRMIGRKTGTGGSAGYSYLKSTAESHRVFADLFNISTFLIPRSRLPELPDHLKKKLSFYFSQRKTAK